MLSFPFAYFFYDYVLQNGYFDFISAMIIFVLLGVGADDVFVFTGTYHPQHLKYILLFSFFTFVCFCSDFLQNHGLKMSGFMIRMR